MPGPDDASRSPHARLRPLPLEGMRIDGGFWAQRQRLNRDVLLTEGARRLEAAGNFDNLRIAAGRKAGRFRGLVFMDSDVYKWLEALGWELGREPSGELARLRRRRHRRSSPTRRSDVGLSQQPLPGRPAARAVLESVVGPRALLPRAPDSGRPGARAGARATSACSALLRASPSTSRASFGPGRREGVAGPSRDRDRARGAVPAHRRRAPSPPGRAYFVDARGRETLLPTRASARATGRTTRRSARPTGDHRTRGARALPRGGRHRPLPRARRAGAARHDGALVGGHGRAQDVSHRRRRARTTRRGLRRPVRAPAGPVLRARRARRSPRSSGPGGCCSRPATRATPT